MDLEKLKYPIGKFEKPVSISKEMMNGWIDDIHQFSNQLKIEVNGLSEDELNLHYRPGGWSIRQVVHHCADSHMNGFIRHKLTLTEDKPTILPYKQKIWADQDDVTKTPVTASLMILEGLCERWFDLLSSLKKNDFLKTYIHPEHQKEFSLEESIGVYAWHGKHHLAHVRQAKKFRENFNYSTVK